MSSSRDRCMKTVISLSDDLFAEAERLARRLGKSRCEVFRTALEEYLARHDPDQVREKLDQVLVQVGESDEFVRAGTSRVLKRSEW